jgi:zinc transport system substrate-binding protein
MRKRVCAACMVLVLSGFALCAQETGYMATTRWVAAITEIAGIGRVESFAPSSMTHPPEYELSPTDILALSKAKVVFSAGYEGKMVKKINETLKAGGSFKTVTVNTENSPENLKLQAETIAKEFGTMSQCEKNLADLSAAFDSAKAQLKADGLLGKDAYVHFHQIPFARSLGFDIVDTFGPGPVTPEQLAKVKALKPAVIIDNDHNMVGKPLLEVSKDSAYASFLNFPGLFGTESIVDVIDYNAKQLEAAVRGGK